MPKKPFYLAGQIEGQPFSVHREGDEVVLQRAGQAREEIELVAPPAGGEAPGELPEPVCPDGSPPSPWPVAHGEGAPGTSPLDEALSADPEEGPAEEGGQP